MLIILTPIISLAQDKYSLTNFLFKEACDLLDNVTEDDSDRKPIDLYKQWNRPPEDQSPFGSCHAFCAVGLVEAAYYRKFKERLNFSEKWVLSQIYTTAHFPGAINPLMPLVAVELDRATDLEGILASGEGFYALVNLEIIKKIGVCEESAYPYWSEESAQDNEVIDEILDYKYKYSQLLKIFGKERLRADNVSKAHLKNLQALYDDLFFIPPEPYNKCQKQAADIAEKINTITIEAHECSRENCHCLGLINEYLRRDIPVAVSIKNYPWTDGKNTGYEHCIIIDGFEPDPKNPDHFMDFYKTRGSYGPGKDYPIGRFKLDDITEIYAVELK
ncbi:hypothetical protein ACFL6Y_08950 [Elusimicrobiota bacterium]